MRRWSQRTVDRFWSKVDVRGPDDCWPYQHFNPERHGKFWVRELKRSVGAHRVAWALDRDSDVDAPQLVCHACDNPPCCNPDHLYAGTYTTNFDDRIERKTGSRPPRLLPDVGLEAPKPNPRATLAPQKPEGKWGAPAGSRTQTPRLEGHCPDSISRKTAVSKGGQPRTWAEHDGF